MRSQTKILAQIKERQSQDMLGFEWPMYIDALEFKNAKKWLKDSVKRMDWDKQQLKTDDEVREAMKKYMDFAWEKANGFRGISAQRSIMHYIAWAWLIDQEFHDELKKEFHENYQYYGKDILVRICEYLELDPKQWDDGVRKNDEES